MSISSRSCAADELTAVRRLAVHGRAVSSDVGDVLGTEGLEGEPVVDGARYGIGLR